ncbi:MAG: riboflavin synthase [Chitinispirillaceae bacterium]|nr:riboflavin synthase [Chitinispirillaceae bacterium]
MFTGLIECTGTVVSASRTGSNIVLGIKPCMKTFTTSVGASVAIDGACLTVERIEGSTSFFSAVLETLNRTTLQSVLPGRAVNMERALKIGDRLDGHFVAGHIDGVGTIVRDRDRNGSILRTIRVPEELNEFMAEKGSVAIDGISLTVASSGNCEISISCIPLTLQNTVLSQKKVGDYVNIECDVLARYIKRIFNSGRNSSMSGISNESLLLKMEGAGF